MESLFSEFLIIGSAIFAAELTDKDALLLLALATRTKPWHVFAAGSVAFTVTTAIIVLVGVVLGHRTRFGRRADRLLEDVIDEATEGVEGEGNSGRQNGGRMMQ